MNKQEFKERFSKGIVLLDGATGSNLQKKGMPSGICVEQWVCEHEDALISLQKDYVEAGSDVVYASTFAANRIKLAEFGLQDETVSMNQKLVGISRKAAGEHVFVAGDVTMTGQQLEPLGSLKFEELVDAYKEQMKALEDGGADFLAVETMMSLQETRAVLLAAKEAVSLPVLVTMSFGEDGRTLYGTDAVTAAVVLEGLGADAVGINCSAGPDKMLPMIQQMRSVCSLPIVAKPNAGMPKLGADGTTEYDMSAQEFVQHMQALVEAGATILGGCCGTNPEYISGLKTAVSGWKVQQLPQAETAVYLTSERKTMTFDKDCTIGTIDAAEDEELAEDLADDIYDTLYDCIDECSDEDAEALCLCMDGVEGISADKMREIVRETVSYTSLPLMFASSDLDILEAALRAYPGRSVVRYTGNDAQITQLAAKYGAAVSEP